MFIRALIAFIMLPGLAAVIAPPLIVRFDPWAVNYWPPGIGLICAGASILLWCVRDFYVSGKGTLAPWDPPTELVVIGLYRFARNPMYIGVITLILGWAAYYLSPLLAIYALVLAIAFHIRVVTNEEPHLDTLFGSKWRQYSKEVPRWLPRLTPWYIA